VGRYWFASGAILTTTGENEGDDMAVRLVVTITAAPGKGSELAQAYKARCEECMKEPGCEQFEVFQSALNPDKLALLERWSDQAALDVHAKLNTTRPALRPELRVSGGEREDYQYNRTR
jgi:quinol monooxygenase YgiN